MGGQNFPISLKSLVGLWGNKGWHSQEADEDVGAPRGGWNYRRFYPENANVLVGIILANALKKRSQWGECTDFFPGNADGLLGLVLPSSH